MSLASMLLVLLTVVIGCGVPIQAGANATLARFYGHSSHDGPRKIESRSIA